MRAAVDAGFVVDSFQPAYMAARADGRLADKLAAALAELADCCACPRECGVDRLDDDRSGTCRTGRHAVVSSAFAHFGEEDCLRGWNGSGMIFFASCNLKCVFCQNWDTSQQLEGRHCDANDIAHLALGLQDEGCHNINFVTPEHVVPQVVEAIAVAADLGLRLPIVYNTSAYDSVESLRLLDGLVDIYMPDFKFWSADTSRLLAKAGDYPVHARAAIAEMHRQVGDLRFGADGLARRGLLVRHLVMPGQTAEAAAIFGWLATELSPDTYVNVMAQYRPEYRVPDSDRYAEVDRRPGRDELADAYAAAEAAGLWRLDGRGAPVRITGGRRAASP